MALSESLRASLLFWYGQVLTLFKRHSRALEVSGPWRARTRATSRRGAASASFSQSAIEAFERALAANANVDRAWYGLGLSLAQLGRLEEAAGKFQEAARLQPLNPFKGFDPKVAERIRTEFGVR